jgi:hypothetical protein
MNIFPSSPPLLLSSSSPQLVPIEIMDGNRNTKPEPTDAIPKGQASPARRPSSTDTERPPSAQQFQHDVKGDPEEGEEEDIGDDPAEKIVDFDWDKLSERYHEAMTQCQNDETALMQEWESLMNVLKMYSRL